MNLKWIPILVHCGDWSDDPCWELKRNHTLNLTQPPRMSFRRPLFWRRAAGHQPLLIRTGFFWVGKTTLSIIGAFERLYFSCKFFCANPMYYSITVYLPTFTCIYMVNIGEYTIYHSHGFYGIVSLGFGCENLLKSPSFEDERWVEMIRV